MQNDNDIRELKAKEKLQEVTQNPIISEILSKLKAELPKDLLYHNAEHTEEVLQESIMFTVHDGLNDKNIELISIAAAYHDAGFIYERNDNEPIGARLAEEAMSKEKYSEKDIETVKEMILDTKLKYERNKFKRNITNYLSPYLLDADLSNLGCKDFFKKNKLILEEINAEPKSFLKTTVQLMKDHKWLTPAAQKLREDQKQKNLEVLRAQLHSKN